MLHRWLSICFVLGGSACGGDLGAESSEEARLESAAPLVEWPNLLSRANSDPWLAAHHDEIGVMRPRVLSLHFVNRISSGADPLAATGALHAGIIAGLKEGSRYHGYRDDAAPAFLQYQIAKTVDLSDQGRPPTGWNHLNSSRLPLTCQASAPYAFDYSALFSQAFADAYAIPDPANAAHNLTLGELVERGLVHEVWLSVNGDPDPYTCPNGVAISDFQLPEVLEYKQKYDAAGRALAGQFESCAGNGCFDAPDTATLSLLRRSIRILYTNLSRGSGCSLHSLGHGLEWLAEHETIPAFSASFLPFANFDLNRGGLFYPHSLYDVKCPARNPACISYPTANTIRFPYLGGLWTAKIEPYDQGCGSVHFPPNARMDYDDHNVAPVLSTCEHFGLKDGASGADAREPYTSAKSQRYDAVAPDCQGGWQVYWRQSFPGYGTRAAGDGGRPMRNWWPYLFY